MRRRKKQIFIQVRVSERLKTEVRQRALESGMDVSTYVRFVLSRAIENNGGAAPKEL